MVEEDRKGRRPPPAEDSAGVSTLMLDVLSEEAHEAEEEVPLMPPDAEAAPQEIEIEDLLLGEPEAARSRGFRRAVWIPPTQAPRNPYSENSIARDAERGATLYTRELRRMQAGETRRPAGWRAMLWILAAITISATVWFWM